MVCFKRSIGTQNQIDEGTRLLKQYKYVGTAIIMTTFTELKTD